MSKENVKKFFTALEKDDNLKKKFMATMDEFMGKTNPELAAKMIEMANDAGFSFTDRDLSEFRNDLMAGSSANGELMDGDLQAVVGGGLAMEFARWMDEMFLRLKSGRNLFGGKHLN